MTVDSVDPRTLKGFRDLGHQELLQRRRIINKIYEVGALAGFQAIMTPALEYAEVLVGAGGGDSDKELYQFKDHGDRDVALRFDLTIPFSRYVAQNRGTLIFPFKKLQVGEVWRGEKPQKGRFREFGQADLDIVGADSEASDLEILSCLRRVLRDLRPLNFEVSVGHRVLLSACIRAYLGEDARAVENKILIAIDKIHKIGQAKVIELIAGQGPWPEGRVKDLISALIATDHHGNAELGPLVDQTKNIEGANLAWDRYRSTMATLRALGGTEVEFKADLSLARGLGYYTGIVFEGRVKGLTEFGSVCAGGRYDRLLERFGISELPAVGCSFGVDRLLSALTASGATLGDECRLQVYVAVAQPEQRSYAHHLVENLRDQGIKVDIDLRTSKLGQQLRQADRLGAEHVVIIGKDEVSRGVYTLKTLASGSESKDLSFSELLAKL